MRTNAYLVLSLTLAVPAACSGNSKTTHPASAGHAGTTDDPGGSNTGATSGSPATGGATPTAGRSATGGTQSTGGRNSTAGTPSRAGTATTDAGESGAPDSGGTSGLGGASGGTAGSPQGGAPNTSGSSGTSSGTTGSAGAPCGDYDEPCCGGYCDNVDSYCELDTASGPTCLQCGVPGAVCCDGNEGLAPRCTEGCCVVRGRAAVCVALDAECPGGGACEADGTCGTCGGPGEDCCQEFPEAPVWVSWCAASVICQRDMETQETACEACGKAGELCCYDPEDAFGIGYCDAELSCITPESGPNRCAAPR